MVIFYLRSGEAKTLYFQCLKAKKQKGKRGKQKKSNEKLCQLIYKQICGKEKGIRFKDTPVLT